MTVISVKKRRQEIRDSKHQAFFDDMVLYDAAEDPEYQAYLERSKAVSSPGISDRYSCVPCGKVNLSLEYYNNHLSGKAHKIKMLQIKKEEGGKGVQRTHVTTHVKTTAHGKVVKEGSDEDKKAVTFSNFFQFLKKNSKVSKSDGSPVPVTVSEKKKCLPMKKNKTKKKNANCKSA